jgi:hypothetical protein
MKNFVLGVLFREGLVRINVLEETACTFLSLERNRMPGAT